MVSVWWLPSRSVDVHVPLRTLFWAATAFPAAPTDVSTTKTEHMSAHNTPRMERLWPRIDPRRTAETDAVFMVVLLVIVVLLVGWDCLRGPLGPSGRHLGA